MASNLPNLTCHVCLGILKNPALLVCGHSFCKDCLQTWWTEHAAKACPMCGKISSRGPPLANLALKNLCENVVEEKRQSTFLKQELTESLKPLKKKLQVFNKVKATCEKIGNHVEVQAQNTEMHIKAHFKKLHQFLHDEEDARIAALREEKTQKSQKIKEKIEGLSREMASLSNTIQAADDQLRADNHFSLLHSCKAKIEQVQLTLQDPQPISGALIDEAKHVGNLTFKVWYNMKAIISYTPVILDPNTANKDLILSDDLTSVRRENNQQLPDNPERLAKCIVLGSEGFNSGLHSWTVEVGASQFWSVGVLEESYLKTEATTGRVWKIRCDTGKYWRTNWIGPCCVSDEQLAVRGRIHRIRVKLDWDKGTLAFYDLDHNTTLHIFKRTITQTLFPFIGSVDLSGVKVLPYTVI